jgi:hypothetical protein
LQEQKVSFLPDVTMPLVENFKVWRIERIKKRKHSRGATGVVLDVAILHSAFSFAVKREMIVKNPVQLEGRPGENPEGGAEPYTAGELSRMRQHTEDDLLAFLLLRWTGSIEKHYTPFVKELRERVRGLLETGVGLEELAVGATEQLQITPKKPN